MFSKGRTAMAGCCSISSSVAAVVAGLVDVLDLALPQVREIEFDFPFDLVENGPGNANAARIGKRFQARCHIDAVAIDVRALDDDVPEIDPDAQPDAPFLGQLGLALKGRLLNLGGTQDGLNNTWELGQ
jgi:hypothetical protein